MKIRHLITILSVALPFQAASNAHAVSIPSLYPAIALDKLCKKLRNQMKSLNQMIKTLEDEGRTDTDAYRKLVDELSAVIGLYNSSGCNRFPALTINVKTSGEIAIE